MGRDYGNPLLKKPLPIVCGDGDLHLSPWLKYIPKCSGNKFSSRFVKTCPTLTLSLSPAVKVVFVHVREVAKPLIAFRADVACRLFTKVCVTRRHKSASTISTQ